MFPHRNANISISVRGGWVLASSPSTGFPSTHVVLKFSHDNSQINRHASHRKSSSWRLFWLFVLVMGAWLCSDGSSVHTAGLTLPMTPGAAVRLEYRALAPGEVVKVSIDDALNIKSVSAKAFGKRYIFGRSTSLDKLHVLIGLDLALKPGGYFIDITINQMDGHAEMIRKHLTIVPRKFPVKKLWVDERFVTPPQKDRERIRRESQLLQVIFSVFSEPPAVHGPFILPLEGKPSHNFGERRIFNNKPRSPHSGEDISAPMGSPVKASNAGRVVLASNLYYSGKTVILDHGLGVFTFYCHFSRISVKRGENVQKGYVIGKVGATGRVTGPHLHWSVRINGSRIDPYSLMFLSF